MTNYTSQQSASLSDAIMAATDCINSLYPLSNFIACNALKEWESMPFTTAMQNMHDLTGGRGFLELSEYRAMYESGRIEPSDLEEAFQRRKDAQMTAAWNEDMHRLTLAEMLDNVSGSKLVEVINKQMVKWCSAYLDKTQAQWKTSEVDCGLYEFWKEHAPHDLSLMFHGVRRWAESVSALPQHSLQCVQTTLTWLNIDADETTAYLRRHVAQLPGFASHLKWRQVENQEQNILADYFAIRLHYERMLAKTAAQRLYKTTNLSRLRAILESKGSLKNAPDREATDYASVWQDAYELNYRNQLLNSLNTKASPPAEDASCQMVFCIDVRSEPIRRELERQGSYLTYGFAGFFGMAMRLTELGSASSLDLCPVLIKPSKAVTEKSGDPRASRKVAWQALKASALQLKKKLKCNLWSAFGLVELIGLYSAFPLLTKTFAPLLAERIRQKFDQTGGGKIETKLDLSAFTLTEKIALAEGAIRGIGLTQFSKVVVLCGHRSSSTNNPFASALDCGACGGNGGGANARLATEILNDREVRVGLLSKRIHIPSTTVFIAAEHDTTTDRFVLFNHAELTNDQQTILEKLQDDLDVAATILRGKRLKTLPQSDLRLFNDPMRRACDWAQIAPEWGLAGNAAFIAAPRVMTEDVDLNGRAFLHSYDYTQDEQGKVLELIMTAPMVVAQWINMQYYLSTVDNKTFGSGSKVLHNVVGDFGVMQGASGDLRLGLPTQSIMTVDARVHEPMRLLCVIKAPLLSIDKVLDQHPEVRKLVTNQWIRLVGFDPETSAFYEATDSGAWKKVEKPVKKETFEAPVRALRKAPHAVSKAVRVQP